MKLWHIVQWGNPQEGGNGDDAQCIVSASSFEEAVSFGEQHFQDYDKDYMDGKCNVVHLIGQDERPDGKPVMVIYRWVQSAVNPSKMPCWYRHDNSSIWEKIED